MDIRPEDISEMLMKQVDSFDTEADVSETGEVLCVRARVQTRRALPRGPRRILPVRARSHSGYFAGAVSLF